MYCIGRYVNSIQLLQRASWLRDQYGAWHKCIQKRHIRLLKARHLRYEINFNGLHVTLSATWDVNVTLIVGVRYGEKG